MHQNNLIHNKEIKALPQNVIIRNQFILRQYLFYLTLHLVGDPTWILYVFFQNALKTVTSDPYFSNRSICPSPFTGYFLPSYFSKV